MACGGCSKKKTDFSKKLEEAKRMQPQDKPQPPFQKAFVKTKEIAKEIAKESQKNIPPNRLATKASKSQVDLEIHNYRVKKAAEKIKRRQELIKSYQEYIRTNQTNPPDSSQK